MSVLLWLALEELAKHALSPSSYFTFTDVAEVVWLHECALQLRHAPAGTVCTLPPPGGAR